jgi:hypothetical protein
MILKQCKICGEEKSLDFFRQRSKKNSHLFYNQCRQCESKKVMEWREAPHARESYRESIRKHYKNNREKKLKQNAIYRKRMIENDPSKKIERSLRSRSRQALKGAYKQDTTEKILGTSFENAKAHIESQWMEGMNWSNYGLFGWHIDHIMPLSSFDLTNEDEQRKAFHYTNLQPLWAIDNLKKSNKISKT